MNKLRYFSVIAQCGSITKASELLNISQPALSKAIKSLEHEIDKKLFVPSGRGILITDFGVKLASRAQELFQEVEKVLNQEETTLVNQSLRISTFEVFSTYFIGELVQSEFSELNIELYESIPGKLEKQLINKTSDIGITYIPIPHPELDILKVATVTMGVYGKRALLSKHPFEDLPFCVPISDTVSSPSKVQGLDSWPDHKYKRQIKYKVTMMESALELCRRGLAVGYFPTFVIELHNKTQSKSYQLEQIEIPYKKFYQKQDIFLIKRKTDLESSSFKKIAKILRRVCQG